MKITLQKLDIYQKYSGDIDWLQRIGTSEEKSLFIDSAWGDIDLLLVELRQARDGLLSQEYLVRLDQKMSERVEGPQAIAKLKGMI